MSDPDAFGQMVARSIGWSAVYGGATGAAVGLVVAIGFGSGWSIIVSLVIAVPSAAAIGTLFGCLVGVPTALLTALVARWFPWWLAVGTMVATATTMTVVRWVMDDGGGRLGPVEIVGGVLTAASSWSALPRVMRPGPSVGFRLSE